MGRGVTALDGEQTGSTVLWYRKEKRISTLHAEWCGASSNSGFGRGDISGRKKIRGFEKEGGYC